jgi:sugar phosphate isomerase/epimerase
MEPFIRKVQVNIPFTMLYESYLERFIRLGINPEIGLDARALETYSHAEFDDIARQLRKYNRSITLHSPFIDLSPGSPDPAVRELTRHRFEQMLQLVSLFRPVSVVCHAGYDKKRYGYFRETWVEKSLEMWSWVGERVRNEGARLMLENVYEHGPEDMRILFQSLNHWDVGFCLDTGHQAAFSRTSLEKWVKALGTHIGQLHLHDNSGRRDEHLALGRGQIDFPLLFKLLKAIRKEPPIITLEPHTKGDFRPSLEYLEKVWPW